MTITSFYFSHTLINTLIGRLVLCHGTLCDHLLGVFDGIEITSMRKAYV
ncbi:hypothetical protein CGRA01v4_09989 [Colletotrichum graminicola]|nr:hypothetical protein CGRA01v4_09989 [Colletotrichum graminicola]